MPDVTETKRKPYSLPDGWVPGLPLTAEAMRRIEALSVAYVSLTVRDDGRHVPTHARHWLDAIIMETIAEWERKAPKLVPRLMTELSRVPRPDELAPAIHAARKADSTPAKSATTSRMFR